MPFIDTKVTKKISAEDEKRLTALFGKAIELIPGKSEKWLMLNFTDECRMAFRGRCESDMAMIEVKIFGKAAKKAYDDLTARLTEIINAVLDIPADKIYVKYEEASTWGYNGFNF